MVAQFLVDLLNEQIGNLQLDTIQELPNGTEEFYQDRFEKRIFPNQNWQESVAWKVLHFVV